MELIQGEFSAEIMQIIEEAKSKYIAPIFVNERNCRIDKAEQLQKLDVSKIERLSFSSLYAEEIPNLTDFVGLKDLCFFCGITIEQLEQIDLTGIEKLHAVINPSDSTEFSLKSDALTELYIRLPETQRHYEIGLQGVCNLSSLEIRGESTYSFADTSFLSQLKKLTIYECKQVDCSWFSTLPHLTHLTIISSVIDNFEDFRLPSSLMYLDMCYSEINNVLDAQKLNQLDYLNIFRTKGDITNNIDAIRSLEIERLIISEIDRYKDHFRNGVNTVDAVYRAKSFLKRFKEEDQTISSYIKKRYAGKMDDEIFADSFLNWLRIIIEDTFYACNPKTFMWDRYNVGIKKWLLNKMQSLYPFFDYADLQSQVAAEEKGFNACISDIKSEGFTFVGNDGVYRVCYRSRPGKGIDLRTLPMHDYIDKKRRHRKSRLKERDIKKAISKYIPEYDFDSQKLEIVILDFYGNDEWKKLEFAVLIAANLFHHNIHINDDVLFAGELNSKAEISRWEFGSARFLPDIGGNKLVVFTTQKKHPLNYGNISVDKYADMQSFVSSWERE